MRGLAIIGIGIHPWGKFPEMSVHQLNLEVARMALKDANMDWKDIQGLFAGQDPWAGIQGMLSGNVLAQDLGVIGIPVTNNYNACATGGYALRAAHLYITSGMIDTALVIGGSISPKGAFGTTSYDEFDATDQDSQRFRILGSANFTGFAMAAQRRMHEYGLTEEDIALQKVKASKFGSLNPNARYQKVFTKEEVLNSPMVAYPIHLFSVCATSDGAAAVVVCGTDVAKKYTTKPIIVAGIGAAGPMYPTPGGAGGFGSHLSEVPPPKENDAGVKSTLVAYEEAGVGPEDLDFACVYDLTGAMEIQWYEDIGLCKEGEGEKLLREGDTSLGGRIPVCTDGGCTSLGECIPAQALSQTYEAVTQLRGDAGARQVEGAKVGFSVNSGKLGNSSAIVYKR
jgi:acetyl-CoA acetyltransferase